MGLPANLRLLRRPYVACVRVVHTDGISAKSTIAVHGGEELSVHLAGAIWFRVFGQRFYLITLVKTSQSRSSSVPNQKAIIRHIPDKVNQLWTSRLGNSKGIGWM